MDGGFLYSLLSGLIGLASGFQGVYERYARGSLSAVTTLPGFSYLLSRGLLPAGIFVGLYASSLVKGKLWLYALACGTGAETVLRSKIYVKQTQNSGGNVEELLRGPFDLLRWYQSLFLELSAGSLAKRRKRFVERSLPEGVEFPALCDRVIRNLPAWPEEEMRTQVDAAVSKLRAEREAEPAGAASEPLAHKYRLKLGYMILNQVGKKGFHILLAN